MVKNIKIFLIYKTGNISKHDSLQICDCGLMRTHGARRN